MESVTSVATKSASLSAQIAVPKGAPAVPGADEVRSLASEPQNPALQSEDAVVITFSGQKPAPADDQKNQKAEEAKRKADQQETKKLQERDREVKAHEQAHLGALGQYKSGGASYTYETGPDGRQYAVGGEVPVDVSAERTPQETIRKTQTVRRAALAPAEPSGADRAVAAKAAQLEAQARAEIAKEAQSGKERGENPDLDRNTAAGTESSAGGAESTGSTPAPTSAKLSAYRRVPITTSSKADSYA